MADKIPKPNYLWSLFTMKCPRCRRGSMFVNNNAWNLRKVFKMPVRCPECNQLFELEVGFWYGTGYVSYVLSVLVSILSFVLWYVIIGMSVQDTRFFWWLGLNVLLLIILQPWLMRFSRVLYLYFFVRYDPDYKTTSAQKFDYQSESYYIKDEDKPTD
jgi:hypothetical protein